MDEVRDRRLARAVSCPLLAASSLRAALRSRPRITVALCTTLLAVVALAGDPRPPTLPAARPLSGGDRTSGARAPAIGAAADAAAVVATFGRRAVPVVALLGTGLGSSPVEAVPASVTTVPPATSARTDALSTAATGSPLSAGATGGPIGAGPAWRVPAVLAAAYAAAARSARPSCHLPTTLLAGIGEVESASLRGRALTPGHVVVPAVLGPRLDGTRTAAVQDTDRGALDGDPVWDRAVGPMQFLPGTWRRWGRDGDADGARDPQDIEDAVASAAAYLCASGRDLARPADLRAAVLSYNHSSAYLAAVLRLMARAEVPSGDPVAPAAAVVPAAGAARPAVPPATRPGPTPPRTTVTVTTTVGATATVTATVTTRVTSTVTVTARPSPSTTPPTSATPGTPSTPDASPTTTSAPGTPAPSTGTPKGPTSTTGTGTGAGEATSLTGTPVPTP